MRKRAFSNPVITGRSFEHIARAALLGLACGASACSGASNGDCTRSRTCAAPDGRALTVAGNDAGPTADGGAGGGASSRGGAAAANGGTSGVGGSAGTPGSGSGGAAAGTSGSSASPGDGARATSVEEPDGGASDTDGGHGSDGGKGGVAPANNVPPPTACTDGWSDCNGIPADGCEVDTSSNTTHCGACGRPCSVAGAVMTVCEQGECKPTCDAEHADCDGNPDDGCETAVSTNPNNCGACGHDCQGGACRAGQCQPTAVAKGLGSPMFFTLVGKVPYVVEWDAAGEQLVRIDPGGAVTGVGSFIDVLPSALASYGSRVYWAIPSTRIADKPADGEIGGIDTDDGSALHGPAGIDPVSLVVDGTNAYWGDSTNYGVYRQNIATKTTIQLTTEAAYALVSDGTTLFGATYIGSEILTASVGGGASSRATQIGDLTVASRYIAVDGQHVYAWFVGVKDDFLHLEQLAKADLRVLREVVASTADSASGPIAVAGNYVYFRKDDGLYRASTTSTKPAALVAHTVGKIDDIKIANGVLYWLDEGKGASDGSLNQLVL